MPHISDSQIAQIAHAAGWADNEVPTAVAVALAESGGNSDAVSSTGDYGLWQINQAAHPGMATLDPYDNGRNAYKIWQQAGNKWTSWTAYKNGTYLVYMGRGLAAANQNGYTNTNGGSGGNNPGDNPTAGANLGSITMGGTWLRAGAFLLGALLLIGGAMYLMGTNKTVVQFTKDAATAAIAAAK